MKKIILGIVLMTAVASFCQEEYFHLPVCSNPAVLGPDQAAGGISTRAKTPVVWNGRDYAACWANYADGALYFRRFFTDGTPVSSPVTVFPDGSDSSHAPGFVWNGNGYGVACARLYNGIYRMYFVGLDKNGSVVSGPYLVSEVASVPPPHYHHATAPSLAWNGSGYCVAWEDERIDITGIYANILDAAGNPITEDRQVPSVIINNGQVAVSVVWAPASGKYQAVWSDSRNSQWELWGTQITTAGSVGTPDIQIAYSAGINLSESALDAHSTGCGLVWQDARSGNLEVYYAKMDPTGHKSTTELNVSNSSIDSFDPTITWTGSEFGVFWTESNNGQAMETWFQRVSPSGSLLGSALKVTQLGKVREPGSAFANYGYLVSERYNLGLDGPNYVTPMGCNADPSPPSCPEGLAVYGITGSAATIDWVPSIDNETDIAFYEVYRNGTLRAKTSDDYLNDTGLSTGTTYNYYIRAFNAAGLGTSGCASNSVYLKTNSTLTLKLDKSDPNAHLFWNDEGMTSYNIFRGTSPQVMSLIGNTSGQTADDANVLLDRINYFYTVDDPGQ